MALFSVRSHLFVSYLAACLYASLAAPLSGAEPELLFEDDFSALDGSFDPSGAVKLAVANNTLTFNGDAGYWRRLLYQNGVFGDVDMSAEFQLGSPDAEKNAYVGLVIWARDYDDFTCAAISDSGTLGAFSNTPANQMTKISWRQLEGLKRGPNDWNLLRVVTVGKRAAVYLNGKQVASFKGKPVDGGSLIGMIYSSGSDPSAGRVRNFKVYAPSDKDLKASPGDDDPNMILADDFAELDSAWGQESASLSVKDQKLVIKPDPGYTYRAMYQGELATDVDMTVKLHVDDNDKENACSAGIAFWGALSGDDFFTFVVSDVGQCGVSHRTKDRWLTPMAYKSVPSEAKWNPAGSNELRVVTSGKRATFYINGVNVGTITNAMPPKGDWQFGLYAESSKLPANAEFSALRVRKPVAPSGK